MKVKWKKKESKKDKQRRRIRDIKHEYWCKKQIWICKNRINLIKNLLYKLSIPKGAAK